METQTPRTSAPSEDRTSDDVSAVTPEAGRSRKVLEAPALLAREPRRWILRLGHGRSLLLLTVVSTIGSVVVTLLLANLLGVRGSGYLYSALMGTLVPLIMVPVTMTRIIGLMLELEKTRTQLHHLATHDPLTSAYNRSYFMSRFEETRIAAQKKNEPLSVMMIDVDEFKSINDCYGHVGGDIALAAIAQVMRGSLRLQDIFARYGGEEFIVLMPQTTLEEACQVAEKLRGAVAEMQVPIQQETIAVTVSIGISSVKQGLAHVIDRADAALYEAKRNGRNRWAC